MSVELQGLVKEFRDRQGRSQRVVDGVDLSVRAGELVTLLGPSGCGKTTTLRLIAGFEEPSAGRILLGGQDVTGVPPYRRHVPMVFQSYALFPHLSVRDNAAFGLRTRGVRPDEARRRVDEVAAGMQLEGLLERAPHELSGGQQQRVALLRALVTNPALLLFDEPLSNLDAQMRNAVRGEIRATQKRLQITAIYVTHDQAEAMAISDRIAVMHNGRVAQIGPPAEVYGRPASRFVASFLGDACFVPARIRGDSAHELEVDSSLGSLRVPRPPGLGAQRDVVLVLRPEHVQLDSSDSAGPAAAVRRVVFLGAEAMVELEAAGLALNARLFAPEPARLPEEGATVRLRIVGGGVHVLFGEATP